MPKLSPKHAAFVREYLKDSNATQAVIRAGYSENGARVQGSRLLAHATIRAELLKQHLKAAAKTEVTVEWILQKLRENLAMAMTAQPTFDKKGEPTGAFTYQGSVANKALELLGKNIGMFRDKVDVTVEGAEEIKSGFSLVHDAYAAQQKRNAAEQKEVN